MTDRLAALVKRIAELCQAGLEACHCIEKFHFQWIRPLGRLKTLAFEFQVCSQRTMVSCC
jgi:hypothetical protein